MKNIFLACSLFFFAMFAGAEESNRPELTRMLYHHPGLIDDLAVGLWSWPIPTDFNGDGRLDLIVNCECVPYNGTFRFENGGVNADRPGLGVAPESSDPVPNAAMPIFKPGEKISNGAINVEPSYIDGQLRVLRPAQEFPDYARSGLAKPVDLPLPKNVHPERVRGNMWKIVDFDGDGNLDLAVGIDDWSPYGWADAYDAIGVWQNKPSLGAIYILRNRGTNDAPDYETPFLLNGINGAPLTTYGWPSPNFADFDADGDLDLLCGEFIEKFTYFENVGSRTEPRYAKGVFITTENGDLAREFLCIATPLAFDWTGDGKLDLLCGNEDGRISLYENAGTFRSDVVEGKSGEKITVNVPVFKAPLYFQQEAYELKASSLATPCCYDFDGDGAIDIVTGTTSGNILFFKNLSPAGTEFPKWARPVYLAAGDGGAKETIHITATPNGSIQGPIEDKYGYTAVTVADWDGDGLPDVMANSILGKPVWFKNVGTRTEPSLASARPVEVEWDGEQPRLAWGWMTPENNASGKKALLTQWRTTPVMFDWNDDGLLDLSMLDQEGYFAFFERFRDADGALKLKAPTRIFRNADGSPLRLNDQKAGGSGRRKIGVCDWDGDGRNDLIVNSVNADVLRNVRSEDGMVFFESTGPVASTRLAGHTTSPTPTDFNADGVSDLVIGAEDGRFYYLRNPKSDVEGEK